MSNCFKLSAKLRLFFSIAVERRNPDLGVRCPVSIRKRGSYSQKLIIYPEANYPFFMCSEVMRFLSLADSLGLVSFVSSENGLPVIEISEYF